MTMRYRDVGNKVRGLVTKRRPSCAITMRLKRLTCTAGCLLPIVFGCSSDDGSDATGTGGAPGSTGGVANSGGAGTGGLATGGDSPTGGSTASGGASGGSSSGGVTATGGVSSGGTATGGAQGTGAASQGGSLNRGSGGEDSTGGATGTGGSSGNEAQPSEGCGLSTTGNGNINDAIVTFPVGYDGSTPFPLIFGFHGAGRTNEDFRTADAQSSGHPIEDDYIVVYLKSDGNDWLAGSNVGKFESTLDDMLSTNCVDEGRLFAMGHSSGAQFITTLLCAGEDRFLGTAPVAGGIIGQCNDHPAVNQIYIHGSMDAQRGGGNGSQAAELVISANMCGESTPYEQSGCTSRQGGEVDPGCTEYQDCTHRTVWCSHDDPFYGGSGANHGWPCFGTDAIKTFFDSL